MFDIIVDFQNIPLELGRIGDKWLMLELERIGYSEDKLVQLNRVWIYMKVIFLSDILGA